MDTKNGSIHFWKKHNSHTPKTYYGSYKKGYPPKWMLPKKLIT